MPTSQVSTHSLPPQVSTHFAVRATANFLPFIPVLRGCLNYTAPRVIAALPPTHSVEGYRSIQLSYRRVYSFLFCFIHSSLSLRSVPFNAHRSRLLVCQWILYFRTSSILSVAVLGPVMRRSPSDSGFCGARVIVPIYFSSAAYF